MAHQQPPAGRDLAQQHGATTPPSAADDLGPSSSDGDPPTHDERGKIAKGSQLWRKRDPEKHRASVEAALQRRVALDKILLDCVTPEQVRTVVERLVSITKDGAAKDAVRAAQVLLGVIVPKRPAQAGEVNRPTVGGGATFVFQLPADPVREARRRVENEAAGSDQIDADR